MSILWIKRVGGDSGTIQGNSAQETLIYLAKSDRPDERRVNVYTHRDCPKRYQQHPEAPGLFCESVSATRRKEKYVWDIEALFVRELSEEEEPENPLQRPAKVSLRGSLETYLTQVDGEGRPMMTTAGELFAPQEELRAGYVLTVQKNIPPVFPPWLLAYCGAVSSDVVRLKGIDWPAEHLRLFDLDLPHAQTEGRVTFIPMTLVLTFLPGGWFRELLNQGNYELVEEGTGRNRRAHLERIYDGPSRDIPPGPVMLDRHGRAFRDVSQLTSAQQRDLSLVRRQKLREIKPEEVRTQKFKRGKRLPFSALPLK